jgi:hypothetical protein
MNTSTTAATKIVSAFGMLTEDEITQLHELVQSVPAHLVDAGNAVDFAMYGYEVRSGKPVREIALATALIGVPIGCGTSAQWVVAVKVFRIARAK